MASEFVGKNLFSGVLGDSATEAEAPCSWLEAAARGRGAAVFITGKSVER